jgi:hypothetical protein
LVSTTRDAELLRGFLEERNLPCPACGYSLRGCTSSKCPECGTALELALRARPIPAWWHAGVIGLALAVMMLALLLLRSLPAAAELAAQDHARQLAAGGFFPESSLIDWPILFRIAFALAAGGILLAWLFAARRRFAQWSARNQAGIGLAAASAPLLVVGLLWLLARG